MKAIPILKVTSIKTSHRFYSMIGFNQTFLYRPDPDSTDPAYAGYEFNGATIHLSSHFGDSTFGCAVFLWCDSVDEIYDRLSPDVHESIVLLPTDQSWGNREMYLKDPDGNSIRFSSQISHTDL
ncbi:MAG: glyoxalase superfamily protein [Verrucomicrobiales bacterium]|nr:glyoxalase superfamily protein [Verrucomicrobiales bacterium]